MGEKNLYIIRHAKSDWGDLSLPDLVRPLNERGRQAVYAIAQFLKQQKIKPDKIVSSPATRALHTALGVADILGYPKAEISTYSEIYFRGKEGMVDVLSQIADNKKCVFIFSHEPSCSELIYSLAGEQVTKFSTAAIYGIKFNMEKWEDILIQKGEKVLFTSPKQIQPKEE